MKRILVAILLVILAISLTGQMVLAGGFARRPAIISGADRVVELQRTDTDWEGTWYWYVGNTYNATNLTGVTALGLLEAYRDTKNTAYLDAAIAAADFIQVHLGAGATGTKYHIRTTAPDIVFLHRLSEVTGDASYAERAVLEWNNITVMYPTAASLDSLFKTINRPSTWDIAFFLEAAYLSNDMTWADGAAVISANISDGFYYNDATFWYALNLSGSIRALAGCGYSGTYYNELVSLLGALISLVDDENGVGGWIQDTAYAVMAFSTVGGAASRYGNDLARWLAANQQASGGWDEYGDEYPEINGEAVRALASTIGTNNTLDGFQTGAVMNSSWVKTAGSQTVLPVVP